jgi:ABC-type multidrug transport system fused ATPase/permease subunit
VIINSLITYTHFLIALQTGSLTSQLSDNPQKVYGLAGITLGTIVQSFATLIAGSILGLAFIWKVGLVGIGTLTSFLIITRAHNHQSACIPFLVSTGYIRLVSFGYDCRLSSTYTYESKRIVILKDQTNKKAHADSAQLACEAAGSIRTVASLTREADCLDLYSKSLEGPLKQSNRTAIWANLLFAFSQAQVFGVIALVFWYGAVLVSRLEATTFQFFIALMVYYFLLFFGGVFVHRFLCRVQSLVLCKLAMCSPSFLTFRQPKVRVQILSSSSIPFPRSMQSPRRAKLLNPVLSRVVSDLTMFTSDTLRGLACVSSVVSHSMSNLALTLRSSEPVGRVRVPCKIYPFRASFLNTDPSYASIQLIERFYDPLAGEIYVSNLRLTG